MPRLPVPAAMAEQRFPDPIAREADVLGTIEHLGAPACPCAGAARRGRAAVPGRAVSRRRHGASARDRHRLAAARSARACENCSRSGLPCSATPAIRASATTWCGSRRWSPSACDPAQTGLAGRRSRRRTGASDRPARRALWLAPRDAARAAGHAYSGICGGECAGACAAACGRRHAAHRAGLSFRRPAACGCSTGRSRSTPSPRCRTVRPIRFSWRHVTHQVAQVEGPERIAMEWWRDDRGNKLTRDYFRVESKAGARMWLYREGLLRPR